MAPDKERGPLPLRHHLAFRFGLVLCAGVAAILVGMGLWNIATQRRHMIDLTGQAADRAAALIRGATRDGMLRGEMDQVNRIFEQIGTMPGIDRIRLLDRKGKVHSSTTPADVGENVPFSAFQCRACHVSSTAPPLENPPRKDRVQIVEGGDGQRLLDVIAPIHNEPACWTADCHWHPQSQSVLGVIDVQMPLGAVDELISDSEGQLAVGLLVTLLATVLLTGVLTWRMVVRRVRILAAAAERVAGGDLDARVTVRSHDEVGRMGHRWNRMVDELARAREELQGWSNMLELRVAEKTKELKAAHQRMLVVEKMASLGKLAAVMAHEINNPLAGIATYAKLMRRQLEKDEASEKAESDKVLELIESEAGRCGQIVRNLLLFSRTPGARFSQESLGPILERCALLVHHQAELEDIQIHVEVASDLPRIVCDPSQIQQVVLALIMNAIEAMTDGGTLTVGARPASEAGYVVIQVEDTGRGIRNEDLRHVFEPFFTTKEQGEGIGLGLSVVYGIVQRHHGRVDVESAVGEGTTFTVHLPIQQPSENEGEDTSA